MGDTPGYKQHLALGTLRAIETRSCIARSANTGISCFIDKYGNITQPTSWWEKAVISGKISARTELTFYVRFGDILSKIAVVIALLVILWSQVIRFFKRN